MTTVSHSDIVNRLKDQYTGGTMYGGDSLVLHAGETISNKGFMGSANVVFLTSKNAIIHEAPGCIAAPLVNMVAKNSISLDGWPGVCACSVRLIPSEFNLD